MPHIHRLYDWVVSVFIVHRKRVLLCYHKKYREWLPVGGHVDLDEDPEEALFKEIREECGLKVKILADRPAIAHPGVKPVYTPSYVDVHHIKGAHKHIALIYFGVSKSARVRLHTREHAAYRWLSARELGDKRLSLTRSIRFYCRKALAAALPVLCLLAASPAWALDPGYRVLDYSGQVEICEPFQQACVEPKPGMRPAAGSKFRTGPDSSLDLVADAKFENMVRVASDSRVTLLEVVPLRFSLDEGALFVLKEEQVYPDVRVLTRDFLVSVRQGGCKVEARAGGVSLKAFSEEINIYPKARGVYSEVPFVVEEGFRYSAEGWARMTYPDYMEWQIWYKKAHSWKDDAGAGE